MESGTRAGIGRSLKFKPQPNKRHSMPIEFASAGSCLAPLPEASTAPCCPFYILYNGVQATYRVDQQAFLSTLYQTATTPFHHVGRCSRVDYSRPTRSTIYSKGGWYSALGTRR